MSRITVNAPAKINLFLHVVGKRDDGYHLLESLVVFADYGDVVEVEESDKISLEIIGKYADALMGFPSENNLVWKAAIAVQKYLPRPLGAKIILTKNLPIASGIGGGSADAAATIKALLKLWKLDISDKKLAEIALNLGSDVPVCLYGKPAIMGGVGEEITPVTLQDKGYIVLINPNIPLATAEVFAAYKLVMPNANIQKSLNTSIRWHDIIEYKNDLEPAAIAKLPIIGEMLDSLRNTQGCFLARMSGSGATCFGLYHDELSAQNAASAVQKIYPQAWCVSAKILD